MEEELPEPGPYICPIFRRDIAGFLPRKTIDQWRLTCRLSYQALSEYPDLLPRRVYPGFVIYMVSIFRLLLVSLPPSSIPPFQYNSTTIPHWFNRKSDGFVTTFGGVRFEGIYKFRFCCKELKVGT